MMTNGDFSCPYCKEAIYDDEHTFVDVENEPFDCPQCKKTFSLSSCANVDYTARGDCKLIDALPHKLKDKWGDFMNEVKEYECQICHSEFYDWQLPGGRFPKLKEGEYEMVDKK